MADRVDPRVDERGGLRPADPERGVISTMKPSAPNIARWPSGHRSKASQSAKGTLDTLASARRTEAPSPATSACSGSSADILTQRELPPREPLRRPHRRRHETSRRGRLTLGYTVDRFARSLDLCRGESADVSRAFSQLPATSTPRRPADGPSTGHAPCPGAHRAHPASRSPCSPLHRSCSSSCPTATSNRAVAAPSANGAS